MQLKVDPQVMEMLFSSFNIESYGSNTASYTVLYVIFQE